MENPNTIGDVVNALVCTYLAALECHTAWRRRRWRANHYRTRGGSSSHGAEDGIFCAVHKSLSISRLKIKEAYEGGLDLFGNEFAVGDDTCRLILQDNLARLQARTLALRRAVDADNCPLELHEVVGTSEAVRVACLTALSKHYQRVAVGRLVPRGLPRAQRRSWLDVSVTEETARIATSATSAKDMTQLGQYLASSSAKPAFHSEPPSPPPTPKMALDGDLQYTHTSAAAAWGGSVGPRGPKNGVFSVFCPEAMKYQVDMRRPLPEDSRRCRCGYDWRKDGTAMPINHGFQITPRFLGKSHCAGGFGCVLCTSQGKTTTYETVEDLRNHINASHTKWQLLHDRDMVGR